MVPDPRDTPSFGGDDAAFEAAVRSAITAALNTPDLLQVDALGPAERAELITHLRQLHTLLTRALAAIGER